MFLDRSLLKWRVGGRGEREKAAAAADATIRIVGRQLDTVHTDLHTAWKEKYYTGAPIIDLCQSVTYYIWTSPFLSLFIHLLHSISCSPKFNFSSHHQLIAHFSLLHLSSPPWHISLFFLISLQFSTFFITFVLYLLTPQSCVGVYVLFPFLHFPRFSPQLICITLRFVLGYKGIWSSIHSNYPLKYSFKPSFKYRFIL